MQGDFDPQLLGEIVSVVGTHADLDERLMQGLVELELGRMPSVAQIRILSIGAQERWLLKIQLLK